MGEYNTKVEECVSLLHEELVLPEFHNVKRLDMWAFKIPNVWQWEHIKIKGISQLIPDGVHFTKVGHTRLYFSMRTIIRELAQH